MVHFVKAQDFIDLLEKNGFSKDHKFEHELITLDENEFGVSMVGDSGRIFVSTTTGLLAMRHCITLLNCNGLSHLIDGLIDITITLGVNASPVEFSEKESDSDSSSENDEPRGI